MPLSSCIAGPRGVLARAVSRAGLPAPGVVYWRAGGGVTVERRSGGCWFSQGTFGLNGVFAESLKDGSAPCSGRIVVPTRGLARPEPDGAGVTTVLLDPPTATRMYWPLASPERLSPAMPTRP